MITGRDMKISAGREGMFDDALRSQIITHVDTQQYVVKTREATYVVVH